jgi:hypothetical protein
LPEERDKVLEIAQLFPDWVGVQNSMRFQSEVLCAMGVFDGVLAMERQREHFCRKQGHAKGSIISLANQVHLLAGQYDRPHEALALA